MRRMAWTPEKLVEFKKAQIAAKAASADIFTFEDHQFAVEYAGYLVEMLEHQFDLAKKGK